MSSLRDGRIPMDNTLLERSFKAIATGRKNYLFLGRETAGPTAAILYTLMLNAIQAQESKKAAKEKAEKVIAKLLALR